MANETSYHQEIEANSRWNFAVNALDVTFFRFGVSFVSQATIMPLLVSQLTSSKIAVGLIPATFSLGFFLPQLFTADFTEGLRRKKPFVMLMSALGERLSYLLIGLTVWWLAEPAPDIALVIFLLLLATSAITAGMATPAWFDLIAKVIPVHRRGLWFGMGNSLGALLGIVGAVLAGRILAAWPFPRNFGLCFILAFAVLVISWVGLALNREPESLTVKPRAGLRHYFGQLPDVLRRDDNYARFLVSRSVTNLGGMAAGFFMVYGKENIAGALEQVGALTAMLVASQAVMNLLWGVVGDQKGHKVVLCGSAFAMALAVAVTWVAASPVWLWVSFALLGIAIAGESTSGLNIILEFCAPEDRPTYIGLTNTLLAPLRALAPIVGGWLATWVGYQGMFVVALLIATLGGVLLTLWVREPRQVRQQEVAVAARSGIQEPSG